MSRATANISATANTMVKKSVVQIIATTNNIEEIREEIRIVTEAIIPSRSLACRRLSRLSAFSAICAANFGLVSAIRRSSARSFAV